MYILYLRVFLSDDNAESAKKTTITLDSWLKERYTIVNTQLGENKDNNMYRIFIDIPIDAASPEEAISKGKEIMDQFLNEDKFTETISKMGITQLNYRLGNDEDRQKSNYFIINDNGHTSTKKSVVNYEVAE